MDDLALIRTGQPGPSISDPVPTPRKEAWEQALGGKTAAAAQLAGRLRGWPGSLTVAAPQAADDRDFLMQLARDTWRGLAALVDREHGLPVDQVGFPDRTVDPARARVGDYTSPSTVGIWLMALAAATELGLIERSDAVDALGQALATLAKLERYQGFFYNYYDTTTLERSSNFISSVNSGWLTAGLMVVRSAFPELAAPAGRLIEDSDYGWLYDDVEGLMNHGYYAGVGCPSEYHYGLLYTEARVLSLIAIGKGDVPEAHWFRLLRTFGAEERWQTQTPTGARGQADPRRAGRGRLVRASGLALRAVLGRQHVRGADADARGRRDGLCAGQPRPQRRGPRRAATPLRARGAGLSGLGPVAERHRGGRRLRRVRRASSRRARLSRRARSRRMPRRSRWR